MRIEDQNMKCSFCDKKAKAGTYANNGELIPCCRSCAHQVLPELMAEAVYIPLQNTKLVPSLEQQNKEMPHHYHNLLTLISSVFYRSLMSLGYDDTTYEMEDGKLVDSVKSKKFKSSLKRLLKKSKSNAVASRNK
jgi:hypothetical protein